MTVAHGSSTSLAEATSVNSVYTAPAGITDNDLLIIWHYEFILSASPPPTPTPPAGFAAIPGPTFPIAQTNVGGASSACWAWYKIASGESGNYTVTHTSCVNRGAMERVTGANTTKPFGPNAISNTGVAAGAGGPATWTGLTTLNDAELFLAFGADNNDTTNNLVAPSGGSPTLTERVDIAGIYLATGSQTTHGATGNYTQTDNSFAGSVWFSLLVAIQPAGVILFDAVLGNTSANSATSISFNTGSAVAAGATVIVAFSWWDPTSGTSSCTIGGLAATNDHQLNNGNDRVAIFSRNFPSGLATNSAIVCTPDPTGVGGTLSAACSYLGITGVDKSGDATATTAAAWAGASLSPVIADSLFVTCAGTDGTQTSQSNTQNVGNERVDQFNAASSQGALMQDLIVAATAAKALSGTWGTTTGLTVQTIGTVIYSGSAAGPPSFSPNRMPFGA